MKGLILSLSLDSCLLAGGSLPHGHYSEWDEYSAPTRVRSTPRSRTLRTTPRIYSTTVRPASPCTSLNPTSSLSDDIHERGDEEDSGSFGRVWGSFSGI